MKNTGLLAILLLFLWSCDSNDIKEIGKGDSNAYFPEPKMRVVVGNTISIPVSVGNVDNGKPLDIQIRLIDSTAVEGDNYVVHSGLTYHFKRGWGTEYIVIEAPEKGDDIMKRSFTIEIISGQTERENVQTTMTVDVMNYYRHPLKNLLGERTFTGPDAVLGSVQTEIPVSIYPDDEDENLLYLSGLTGGYYGGYLPDLTMQVVPERRRITIPAQVFSDHKLRKATGNIRVCKGTINNGYVGWSTTYNEGIELTYDSEGTILFTDWFITYWETGNFTEQPIFIYYGYYGNRHNTRIIK